MSNPNFVSDLVAMAKAFEELPAVRLDLMNAQIEIDRQAATIQRLELRLIERANEIDALHATTRKLEVERDHAEHMFLETDDRLNAFRNLVQRFRAEVETYDAVTDKADPDVVTQDEAANIKHESAEGNAGTSTQSSGDAGQAPSDGVMSEDHIDGPFPYQRAEPVAPVAYEPKPDSDVLEAVQSEGVSVPSDPTPGTVSSSESASQGSIPTDAEEVQALQDKAAHFSGDPVTIDDTGYHNEPKIGSTGDTDADWADWQQWQHRMDAKYGVGRWPRRPDAMPQASRASQYSF